MPEYKVLLTTSGTGSRLKELTKDTNKALVPINGRPTISYILDSYPADIPVVVTLGFLGEQVKAYLLARHSERTLEFMAVDKYVGDGSSLLYSMRSAKSALQCPFIFHACDTVLVEPVPPPQEDWVAGYVVAPEEVDISQYRSHRVVNGYVTKVQDKGAGRFNSIHIGLTGVHDYLAFWRAVEALYAVRPHDQTMGDVSVIERMIETGTKWKWVPFKKWLDTGNPATLKETEEYLKKRT